MIPTYAGLQVRPATSGEGEAALDRFDFELLSRRVAEVTAAIFPELDPTERAIYWALFWRSYGRGTDTCTVGTEALARECNTARITVIRQMKALVTRGLVRVLRRGVGRPSVYQICLADAAKVRRAWNYPEEWDAALVSRSAALDVDGLTEADRDLVETVYRSLEYSDRDAIHRKALDLMRAAGWSSPDRAPEEDLKRYRLQSTFESRFGPDRRETMLGDKHGVNSD